jgi:predicted N-acyltransferase
MAGEQVRILESISEVSPPEWNALTDHEPVRASPFVLHGWLDALEQSRCAAPEAGWTPRHLTLWRGERLVAAAPAYQVTDSDGDFSRDWQWAAAARQAGVRYYPKLVLAVPFTPATGRRILTAPGQDRAQATQVLLEAAKDLARETQLGGVQVLFPDPDELTHLESAGLAVRVDFQYHWRNAGYSDWEAFLARFPSKRRSAIRRERAAPAQQGIAIRTVPGEELAADARGWARELFDLHRQTVDRMAWGMRWVNEEFYRRALESVPRAIQVVEARREGRLVATAFNATSGERLYGRYWGAREEHPFLHFNVCLYHSVEECIAHSVQVFEGGAGGEHKLSRGFEPAETWSAHWYRDRRLDQAVRRALRAELAERREAVARWRESSAVLKPAGSPSGAEPR